MKHYFLLVFLLCGCACPHGNPPQPSTFAVRAAVDSAASATRTAAHRTAEAKASLRVAEAKSRELLTVASSTERPLAEAMQTALEESQTALDGVQDQLQTAQGALVDSASQTDALQKQIAREARDLAEAQDAATRMQTARDFWRAAAWRLALLALALGLWTFRKPLLALCGL